MNFSINQEIPFRFMGEVDDTVVYNMFKHVSTPGYQIDVENMRTP